MSERNGDRARFHKDRKRKLLKRQRLQALLKPLPTQPPVVVDLPVVPSKTRSNPLEGR